MLILGASLALATTDEIGGDGTEEAPAGVVNLVAVQVTQAAVVTRLEFGVSGDSAEEVVLVVYQRDDRGFRRLAYVDADEISEGYASSGDVRWLLEPGEIYAVGAYVAAGYSCYYDEGGSPSPWFGEVVEGYQVEGVAPATFRGEGEPRFYQMRVTSEDADFDGDGAISTVWGGTDCDDSDDDVIEATAEIPYDGIDQDCDGHDLDDLDNDGASAAEAGGDDCDDSTGAIGPASIDTCGDEIDSDCSGDEVGCVPPDKPAVRPVVDGGVGSAGVCGCAATPPGPGALGLGLLVLAAAARRRE